MFVLWIFSSGLWYAFCFLNDVFQRAEHFDFDEVWFIIFSFMVYFFYILSKISLQTSRSQRYSPMFSSRNFILLSFTFRSMIHFELIVLFGVRERSMLIIFYHTAIWTSFSKTFSFPYWIALASFSEISWFLKYLQYISELYILFLCSFCMSIFLPISNCLDYWNQVK